MPDHIHIFIGYNPTHPIPKLVEEIKTSFNSFIKEKRFVSNQFRWQVGYGVFSYGRSQRSAVINYIEKQEEHHHKKTFREEYVEMHTTGHYFCATKTQRHKMRQINEYFDLRLCDFVANFKMSSSMVEMLQKNRSGVQ